MDWQAYVLLGAAAVAVLPGGLLLACVRGRYEGSPEDQEANHRKQDDQSVRDETAQAVDRRHSVVRTGRWPSSWSVTVQADAINSIDRERRNMWLEYDRDLRNAPPFGGTRHGRLPAHEANRHPPGPS